LAGFAEMLPQPSLTRNQVELREIDTIASESLPGFRAIGISQ
jgi:NADH dehydrogenase